LENIARLGAAPRIRNGGALASLATLMASATYEFRMQIRRRSLWLVLGLLGAYMVWLEVDSRVGNGETAAGQAAGWVWLLQVFLPVAFGVLLADRFPRDRKLRVDELLETSPAPMGTRLLGKYLGATAATLVPILATLAAGLGVLIAQGADPGAVITTAIPAFLLVDLPGLLFVAAFSVCCPLIMPVPVYQFLYVGYWFWGNLMPPEIMPTLRDTWLAPIGWQAGRGLFHLFEDTPGPIATTADAVISISILLLGAAAALVAGWVVLRFERTRG